MKALDLSAQTPVLPAERPSNGADTAGTPRVNSETLLGPGGQLVIEHAGRDYKLRITQNGKLILTA